MFIVNASRLGAAVLLMVAFTAMHYTHRQLSRRPRAHNANIGKRISPKLQHCNDLCEQCGVVTPFKALYDGFPSELPQLPAVPKRFDALNEAQANIEYIVVSDDCSIFTGVPPRGPPAFWAYLQHDSSTRVSLLCPLPSKVTLESMYLHGTDLIQNMWSCIVE